MTGGATLRRSTMIRLLMGLLLTTTAGLVVWIVLWAIGVKSFDAFLITILMILVAATVHVFAPMFSADQSDEPERWSAR